jgi:hypothetical protein
MSHKISPDTLNFKYTSPDYFHTLSNSLQISDGFGGDGESRAAAVFIGINSEK